MADETKAYEGPAGVILSREEWLEVWALLERMPLASNAGIRRKVRDYLQSSERGSTPQE